MVTDKQRLDKDSQVNNLRREHYRQKEQPEQFGGSRFTEKSKITGKGHYPSSEMNI